MSESRVKAKEVMQRAKQNLATAMMVLEDIEKKELAGQLGITDLNGMKTDLNTAIADTTNLIHDFESLFEQ